MLNESSGVGIGGERMPGFAVGRVFQPPIARCADIITDRVECSNLHRKRSIGCREFGRGEFNLPVVLVELRVGVVAGEPFGCEPGRRIRLRNDSGGGAGKRSERAPVLARGDFPFCRPRVAQPLLVKHVGIAGPLTELFSEGLLVKGYVAATLRTNLVAAYTAKSGNIVLHALVRGGFHAVPFEVVAGLVHDDSAHASATLRKSLSVTRPCGSCVGQEVNRAAVLVE